MLKILSLKRIKGKVWANTNNVILFLNAAALIIVIGNQTSLVSSNSPLTESWEWLKGESELIASFGGILNTIVVLSSGVGEWVIVRWPMLVEMYRVWISLSILI